jgi:hypothetical protein
MMQSAQECLPRSQPATIIQTRVNHATILALCLLAHGALAQQQSDSKPKPARGQDDLDVTMQIIVDPDAKLPDDVVRRIPLPERKPVEPTQRDADKQADKRADKQADKAVAAEARETAREAKDVAKQEAAEQREQARRARAEERERNPPPKHPPGRPPRN